MSRRATERARGDTLMAFDFGMARIGVATGTREGGVATPLTTLKAVAGRPSWSTLSRLIADYAPSMFVVGCPPQIRAAMRAAMRHFLRQLRARYEMEAVLYDEADTTLEARARIRVLRQRGLRGRAAKGDVDKIAAAIILEDYMTSRESRE